MMDFEAGLPKIRNIANGAAKGQLCYEFILTPPRPPHLYQSDDFKIFTFDSRFEPNLNLVQN